MQTLYYFFINLCELNLLTKAYNHENSKLTTLKTLTLLVLMLLFSTYVWGQTPIDNSYFSTNQPTYLWDIAGSPYEITEDIEIPWGSDLEIEPGVEVVFQGQYKMDVKGSIHAMGNDIQRITFTSIAGNPWNGIRFDFSDNPNPAPSKLYYCDISNAIKTGTTCQSPDPESSGGAIYVESFSDLEIYECNIFNNSVLGHGGAIGIFTNSNPTIEKTLIHDNYAKHKGGGISIFKNSSPDVIGNSFYENESAKGGGAIVVGPLGSTTISSPNIINNTFSGNIVSGIYSSSSGSWLGKGGGMYICTSNPTVKDNIFEYNNAFLDGGGIFIKGNSSVTIENNSFVGNYSNTNGGGIYSESAFTHLITLCQFSNNSAVDGGGIYLSDANITITNCTFSENTASTDGVGIYSFKTTSTIKNCNFEDNTATGNGGGVYLNDPKGNIATNPKINLNSFKSNTASQGSALYCYRNTNNPNQYYNYPNQIINNLFAENNATDKGVVYSEGNNNNTIFNHNTVTNNTYTPPAFIEGICINYNKPSEFKNNIIYESIVDILVIYGNYAYQHPSNYYTTLIFHNHLNEKYDQNSTPPYVTNVSPGFVSSTNYHLTSSSPCVDPSGSDNSATMTNNPKIDLDGNNRIYNAKTDYGCYEFGASPPARKGRTISSNEDNQISVYPNPATDFLYITTSSEQFIDISIYNISGQRVYFSENNQINGEELISVSNFKPGMYIIKVRTETKVLNKRIIIQ